MKKISLLYGAFMCLSLVSTGVQAATPETILKDGTFFGEARYRFEHVDQDNALNDANAHTLRTNLGFKTGKYEGFTGLIEAQIVSHFGDEDFNSLDNGETGFSTVADPDVAQINRAWISYDGIKNTVVKLGRQFLNLDNQRFVGTVGWRQNDQTFDAIGITHEDLIESLKLQYVFVDNVNRIFEGSSPADDLDSSTHLINVSYDFKEWLKATAYGYLMEFDNGATSSNKTYGIRATGKTPINEDWTFSYEAELATQSDYGNNTADYDEDYYHIAPTVSGHGFTFGAGYEVLEGDGTNSFRTPLATLHKFNGWADMFLNTPANGLEDLYFKAGYKVSGTDTMLDGVKLLGVYHDFEGDEDGDYGSEIDLSVGKSFTLPDQGQPFDKINVTLKYSDYEADDTSYVDTQKFWLQIGLKF